MPINAELTGRFAQKPKESPHFGVGGSALSKALEEGKELVGRTIAPVSSIERLRFCEGLLLDSKVRVQVHLCRFHMLMAEPQGDHLAIHAALKQNHGKRVAQHMGRDSFSLERGTRPACCYQVLSQQVFHTITT